MLTKMEVFSPSLLSIPAFEFDDNGNANLDKIQIHDIAGLDPVTAAINTSQYGSIDGSYYTGSSVGQRNIVLSVGFHPDWNDYTMEDLRMILYQYFMPKRQVTMQFESTHLPEVTIDGFVESLTPNIFSQDPEIQISIICPNPDFVAIESLEIDGVVSAITPVTFTPIAYEGSIETPMDVTIKTSAGGTYTGNLYLMNYGVEQDTFTVAVALTSSAYVEFNSADGARAIDSVAGGVHTSLIKTIGSTATWLKLNPGLNNFAIASATPANQRWVMTYNPRYGGL
jgi:Phage tail protein